MTTRTITTRATFVHSFVLDGFDEVLPPGTYTVETDEELIGGLSFAAYRRRSSVVLLPATSGNPALTRALTIDPKTIDAALKRDRSRSETAAAVTGGEEKSGGGSASDRAP